MAKEKRPKDDLQTVAKSRMAQMPAETAGGRLDQSLSPGAARPDRSDRPERPDLANRRDPGAPQPGQHSNNQHQHNEFQRNQPRPGQPHEMSGPQSSTEDLPPKPMSRADKQRNQPRR
ncbi:hypothetical protein RB614_19200 [Phytohabitans sp. ZYX-F-186]|uniref:Uncharacterized protein n=1 Tax=Phytohabitans maris TaxID=3071409 RepID=A0ABU0ZHW5_9ACTN|nr:hypothetical protein [Phytohabitans sp. ZYX-F-186]MDQ7906646.1 hypothetical protein [Phytohabitans sp. ZYX-F-186]